MRKIILFGLALGLLNTLAFAANKEKNGEQGREFRAVWVATVNNIDWPSRPGLTTEQQKAEIRKLLDRHKSDGMNAIIMQVRPSADAFFPSDLEPWSKYLQGTQGEAPSPYYDPLDYFIEQCHLRGMEFHAWFNPYRVKQGSKDQLVSDHIFRKNPDWGWSYGDRTYFDPGHPEVRNYLVQVVREVVQKYDVDAIHFDDYFYPYRVAGEDIPDLRTFRMYPGRFYAHEINDWRRENVNIVIRMLSKAIKEEKPWVKFGISPFGVWRNRSADPEGSDTKAGTTNYDDLYADILLWQREGWIDYTLPQLYWEIGHPTVDFNTLAEWWASHSYNRAMYIGHAIYKLDKEAKSAVWQNPKELIAQINKVRATPNLQGSAWYSSVHFKRDLYGFRQMLLNEDYSHPALIPTMPWIDDKAPAAPSNLMVENVSNGQTLSWNRPSSRKVMDQARFFAVYGSTKKGKVKRCDPSVLIEITGSDKLFFRETGSRKKRKYYYTVTSLDRGYNQSGRSEIVVVKQ